MRAPFPRFASPAAIVLFFAGLLVADPSTLTMAELLSQGRMNELISALNNRDDAESYNLLSRAYYAIEQWDTAIRNGERAVSLRPDDTNYHLWLGRQYGQKAAAALNPLVAANYAHKAKLEFERAVKLDPSNVPARADLAEYYTQAPAVMGGGTDKARDQAAAVQKYDPATAYWIRSIAAQKDKRYGEAESDLKAAVGVARNPAQYWTNLAWFYRERGRLDDMERAVQAAIAQLEKPAITYYDAANELFEGGRNYPGAVQYLKSYLASGELVEDAPAFRAHYLLGQIYEKSGNKSAAIAEYQASLSMASGFERARKALEQLR